MKRLQQCRADAHHGVRWLAPIRIDRPHFDPLSTWPPVMVPLLLLLAFGLAGCVAPGGLIAATITAPTRSIPAASNQLAYISDDGNIYVAGITSAGALGPTTAITADAGVAPEGAGRSYHRIAWSRDGQLAFAAVERQQRETRSQIYVVRPLSTGGAVQNPVAENDHGFVIYMHWQPAPCTPTSTCRLAYLIGARDEQTIELRMIQMEADGSTRESLLAAGRPFYFSWSPDGAAILGHRGGARFYNSAADYVLIELDTGKDAPVQQALDIAPGLLVAPAWSPEGTAWAGVEGLGQINQLQIRRFQIDRTGGTNLTVGPTAGPPVVHTVERIVDSASNSRYVFSWSPDGSRLAYALRTENLPAFGPIHIIEIESNVHRQITDSGFRIQGFFWSPDGARLAYLTHLLLPEETWMQWRVYDLARNEDRGYEAFRPSDAMRVAIGSFNQYGQSHRFWSPDGHYLIYAQKNSRNQEHIYLIDTLAPRGADPLFVASGGFAVWSFGSLPQKYEP